MFKLAMVAVLAIALTGCVSYTNSKGEKCTTSLDPLAWAMAGVTSAGTASDQTGHLHNCKPE